MFFVWDAEHAWMDGAKIILGKVKEKNLVRFFFDALIECDDFKMQFADRVYKHLFNDGALTNANAQTRWLQINNLIDRAIVAESARWGDVRYNSPITYHDWLKARDNVLAQMDGNADKLVALLHEAGYYPNIDPPVFNQRGGLVTNSFQLTMTVPEGTIYYTTNGSDPRSWGTGEIAPAAVAYNSPIVLTSTTQIKARTLTADSWSALNEATFRVVEQDRQLRITEIMYNPVGSDDYEFIELKNTGDDKVNLSNMTFEGILFTFFPNTRPLAPGEFLVLVRNRQAFAERYPEVSIRGQYGGQLSNKGEQITLKDGRGQVVVSVKYDDENGWPISPDNRGDSLVLIKPDGDPNDPQNWQASANLNGSPGADEPAR
jgi:hypothetical protein